MIGVKGLHRSMLIISVSLSVLLTLTACSGESEGVQEDAGQQNTEIGYSNVDIAGIWDKTAAKEVNLSGKGYEIVSGGVYVFTGETEDGQIRVNVKDGEDVQIVLNGTDISCQNGPAIQIDSDGKTLITAAENTQNRLSAVFSIDDEQKEGKCSVIFSGGDLTVNGTGSLYLSASGGSGIASKGTLKITGGDMEISADCGGISGEQVGIYNGVIDISSVDSSIISRRDGEKGCISVDGGEVALSSSAGCGIDAAGPIQFSAGDVEIDSAEEGIFGESIRVAGGNLSVWSAGSCISSAASEKPAENDVEISGGILELNSSAGDGVHAGGTVLISGGNTLIQVPADSGRAIVSGGINSLITGGTLIGIGDGDAAENSQQDSRQVSVLYRTTKHAAGTQISVFDYSGEAMTSITAGNSFSCVLFSHPDLRKGESCDFEIGGDRQSVDLSSVVTDAAEKNGLKKGDEQSASLWTSDGSKLLSMIE